MENNNNNNLEFENLRINSEEIKKQIDELRKIFKKNSKKQTPATKMKEEISKNKILNSEEKIEILQNFTDSDFEKKLDSKSKRILDNIENQINVLLLENTRLREDRLKALANLENSKKAMNVEIIELRKYKAENFIKNLLPVIDNFERAISIPNNSPEVKNFLLGFSMIMSTIKNVFTLEGVQELDTKIGDIFNSDIHSAVEITTYKTVPSGTISKILNKGYKLHERVIRPTMVNVEK